jgi:hypothetical protein
MVATPAGGAGFYYSSLWIGLGDSQSLLQAGTEQDTAFSLVPNTASTTYAWYKWFPGTSVDVGLEVLPGHSVGVNLEPTNDGTGSGQVSMINYTTGVAITPVVVVPPTTDFNNNPISPPILNVPSQQASWIMERPSLLENGVPVAQGLADFGISGFLFGGALDVTSGSVQKGPVSLVTLGEGDQGTLLNMLANDGVTVLAEAQERPGLTIFFTGP